MGERNIKDNEEDGSRVTRVMRNERPNQQVWEWPGKVIRAQRRKKMMERTRVWDTFFSQKWKEGPMCTSLVA